MSYVWHIAFNKNDGEAEIASWKHTKLRALGKILAYLRLEISKKCKLIYKKYVEL